MPHTFKRALPFSLYTMIELKIIFSYLTASNKFSFAKKDGYKYSFYLKLYVFISNNFVKELDTVNLFCG